MRKLDPDTLAVLLRFVPGTRVEYIGAAKPANRGRTGTVIRPIKSRGVVTVKWDSGGAWYDAWPESLEML